MKKIFKFSNLLFLSSFFISGCCDPTFGYLAPHKYISGEKAFDLDLREEIPNSIEKEGFENVFKKVSGGFSFDNDLDLPIINNQLYFADINCDDFAEICYKYVNDGDEANVEELIIYDYKNSSVLNRITCVDDFSGSYIDGAYFFTLDEENDISIMHSLQSLYYPESDEEDAPEIEHRCYDTNTKFLINNKNECQMENIDIPFQVLGAYLYAGNYDPITGEYSYETDIRLTEYSIDEELYLFVRVDYEGTYYTSQFDQQATRFTSMTTENVNNYRTTFITDLPSKKPYLLRVYKIKFLRVGEIRVKMIIKRKEFTFSINVI